MLYSVFAIVAVLSLVLTIWRWTLSERFVLHRAAPGARALPGVTFLKPLKGCNAETKRCLRSWFTQRYPGPVQLLFGVADDDDPVCELVRALQAEFPCADAHLIVARENLGANAKISTLRQLEPLICHPFVMVSDADVEAPAEFAASVAELLAQPGAGLVNCFYRLANPSTVAMWWEAVCINADFWNNVLQAHSLGPVDFALGAVMSLPTSILQKIGGFAPMADYLADDYELGRRIVEAGGRVQFTDAVVDCREAPAGWGEVWAHQLRWARTIRACRPLPYFMSLLGNATLWPMIWALAEQSRASLIFLGVAMVFRMASAARQQKLLTQSNGHSTYWWLTPIKDLLEVLIWTAAFCGNHVDWRGERYRIVSGGKLLKIEAAA